MSQAATVVEKTIKLSADRIARLDQMARLHGLDEDQIVEKALDILFTVIDLFDEQTEQQGWPLMSEGSLKRIWDNEEDAVYDDWRTLYDVPSR
jgi:hypothetical protein